MGMSFEEEQDSTLTFGPSAWDCSASRRACLCHFDGSFPTPDGKDLCSFCEQKTPEDREESEKENRHDELLLLRHEISSMQIKRMLCERRFQSETC